MVVSVILVVLQRREESDADPNVVVLHHYTHRPYETMDWQAGTGQLGAGFYVFVEQRPPSDGLWWAEYRIARSAWNSLEKVIM